MKTSIFICSLLLFLSFTSSKSFAQPAPGNSGAGDGSVSSATQPCPTSFKRNNGNGTCGGDAQIRLSFSQLPEFAPTLVGILYDGVEINTIHTPVLGDTYNLASKGYISYCLSGANIPPATKLTLHFRYPNSNQDTDCVLFE